MSGLCKLILDRKPNRSPAMAEWARQNEAIRSGLDEAFRPIRDALVRESEAAKEAFRPLGKLTL